MIDFKIKQGLSTLIFSEPGVANPRLVLEAGCWYLCTDTAELFLGIEDDNSVHPDGISLKRINGTVVPSLQPDEGVNNLKFLIEDLDERVAALEDIELFQKLEREEDLPTNFDSPEFNPNVTYYIQSAGQVSTFIYDNDTQGWICTNASAIDEDKLRELITIAMQEQFGSAIDEILAEKVPEAVQSALNNVRFIYGGNATADTADDPLLA